MKHIIIKKGHDVQISGIPNNDVKQLANSSLFTINPNEFKGLKPKSIVNVGDKIKIGSPLFFDKNKPAIKVASTVSGEVKELIYGNRRLFEKIIIKSDDKLEALDYKSFTNEDILRLDRDKILDNILSANIFHVISQRPFNKVANPADIPRDIFISCKNTAPLSVNLESIIAMSLSDFQSGVNALSVLTEGDVFLTSEKQSVTSEIQNARINSIEGPHPSGNVGVQIHHLSPIKPEQIIWTINAQDVIMIGKLFRCGELDFNRVVSVGGPQVLTPTNFKIRIGNNLTSLFKKEIKEGNVRIIAGNVLDGKKVQDDYSLGFYDFSICAISEDINREFLGMLKPGSASSRYSLSNSFFTAFQKLFDFTASQNGNHRAVVPIGSWEKVLPLDIYPNELYRAILAEDIEEMEQLGILECDSEDFSLCSFVCPSKTDVSGVIKKGLALIEAGA
mgnify:CR=1 FL=1